eukprot:GEZU01014357.1.p2 GENE.GEZU01014357.1~~GEZU01014357.1.p2  ORF type:complete len:136 (-),score=20.38 GEZU01014357.1:144-551(-)
MAKLSFVSILVLVVVVALFMWGCASAAPVKIGASGNNNNVGAQRYGIIKDMCASRCLEKNLRRDPGCNNRCLDYIRTRSPRAAALLDSESFLGRKRQDGSMPAPGRTSTPEPGRIGECKQQCAGETRCFIDCLLH